MNKVYIFVNHKVETFILPQNKMVLKFLLGLGILVTNETDKYKIVEKRVLNRTTHSLSVLLVRLEEIFHKIFYGILKILQK